MYIKNRRNSSKIKGCSSLQVHRKLIQMCFEIGNFSYTERYPFLAIDFITQT